MIKQLLTLRHLLIAACLLILTSGCASSQIIVNNITEKEANEIVVFLASKGIQAEKVAVVAAEGGGGGGATVQMFNISVDASQIVEAMAILNQNGLPRKSGQNLLDLFQKSGLVSTDTEEQVRYQQGLAEQIANVIRKIDGVLDASVQLSIPTAANPNQVVRASVYVKHQGVLDNPNSQLITKIKRLVAASVNGLDYNNVTVIPDRARFSDVTVSPQGQLLPEEEKEYVNVWSVVVSKDSVGRFRGIFFSFCVSIILLAAILAWVIWKLYPLLAGAGGFKALVTNVKPLGPSTKTGSAATPSEKDETKPPEASEGSEEAPRSREGEEGEG